MTHERDDEETQKDQKSISSLSPDYCGAQSSIVEEVNSNSAVKSSSKPSADDDDLVDEIDSIITDIEVKGKLDVTSLQDGENSKELKDKKRPVVENENPFLFKISNLIREGKCKNITVLSGAGVSCSAGIPDFRTPGTGLYDNLQKYDIPYPEAVFDLEYFSSNPAPFASLASEIWPGTKHSPTITHSFITLLHRKGILLRNYTQNIDGLEVISGLPESKLVECHGHFRTATCIKCSSPFDGIKCKDSILNEARVPTCPKCHNGLIKPDIVFFGESLPERFTHLLKNDLDNTDLLFVIGTSLEVAPVSYIPEMIHSECPRVLLNRELVGNFQSSKSGKTSTRDTFVKDDCDTSVRILSSYLGW
eukprot:CAMPEP_0184857198 /NCGR_PEP_ID=MMETSP0580-20130426/2361_1 /TAXON_ID=1118495 /ORGANISM="Dactyliosolen fragilissimus" /LENGTH=362 /DNA_ID=CAMNT_0027352653 /DNA_START=16 /DNA_END=1101 /DNA_ORIENTATION=+